MNCMKCGRETEDEQVFCNACLEEMKKYPVKPGTPVHLPVQRKVPSSRKVSTRRRTVSPEEQIRTLKKRLWFLTGILLVTLTLLAAMIYPTVNYFIRHYHLQPGQNYTAITTQPSESAPK